MTHYTPKPKPPSFTPYRVVIHPHRRRRRRLRRRRHHRGQLIVFFCLLRLMLLLRRRLRRQRPRLSQYLPDQQPLSETRQGHRRRAARA